MFFVQIHGCNAVEAYATSKSGIKVSAYPNALSGRVSDELRMGDGRRALFSSRQAANEAGMAARWNNQTYSVHVAKGKWSQPPLGVLEWESCQEGWRP